jgi:hypothetical protein
MSIIVVAKSRQTKPKIVRQKKVRTAHVDPTKVGVLAVGPATGLRNADTKSPTISPMKVILFVSQNVDAKRPLPNHLAAHAQGRQHARPQLDEQEPKDANANERDANAG